MSGYTKIDIKTNFEEDDADGTYRTKPLRNPVNRPSAGTVPVNTPSKTVPGGTTVTIDPNNSNAFSYIPSQNNWIYSENVKLTTSSSLGNTEVSNIRVLNMFREALDK